MLICLGDLGCVSLVSVDLRICAYQYESRSSLFGETVKVCLVVLV